MRLVLTTEDEDPDRDTGQQANARDKPPSPLYGAKNVLNAQDSSSAIRLLGVPPAGATRYSRQYDPTVPVWSRHIWLLFQIEDTTERDPRP